MRDLLLCIERLDDAQPREGLLDHAHESPPLRLPLEAVSLESLAHGSHDVTGYRQDNEDEEGELPADRKKRHEVDDDEDGVLDETL